jgi:hypothetical protein
MGGTGWCGDSEEQVMERNGGQDPRSIFGGLLETVKNGASIFKLRNTYFKI